MSVLVDLLIDHHKVMQWFSYEPQNGALLFKSYLETGSIFGNSQDAVAALTFFAGSSLIWAMEHFKEVKALLFYGGLSLAMGGTAFATNGGWTILAGVATAIASLETARGGAIELLEQLGKLHQETKELTKGQKLNYFISSSFMKSYGRLAESVFKVFPCVGRACEERPFLTGGLIKLPMELFYILDQYNHNSALGMAIGCMWMVGDISIACLDPKVRENWRLRHPKHVELAPAIG